MCLSPPHLPPTPPDVLTSTKTIPFIPRLCVVPAVCYKINCILLFPVRFHLSKRVCPESHSGSKNNSSYHRQWSTFFNPVFSVGDSGAATVTKMHRKWSGLLLEKPLAPLKLLLVEICWDAAFLKQNFRCARCIHRPPHYVEGAVLI